MFFQDSIFLYSRSLKCPLHIASYTLKIGVSVMELLFNYISTQELHFFCAYWKFYSVCVWFHFAETIPYAKLLKYPKIKSLAINNLDH